MDCYVDFAGFGIIARMHEMHMKPSALTEMASIDGAKKATATYAPGRNVQENARTDRMWRITCATILLLSHSAVLNAPKDLSEIRSGTSTNLIVRSQTC